MGARCGKDERDRRYPNFRAVRADSMRKRIGAELELDDQGTRQCRRRLAGNAGRGGVDARDMLRRAIARARPQGAPLPAGVRIVDAAFEPFGEEPHRIGYAQFNKLAVDQRVQRVRLVAGFERHIGAKAQNVVLVDPDVIRVLLGEGGNWKLSPCQGYKPT